MALNDYAYYSTTTGLIENVLWIEDDVAPTLEWLEGFGIVDIPDGGVAGEWSMCGIGWSYINGQFVEPPKPPEPEPSPLPVNGAAQPISQGVQTL